MDPDEYDNFGDDEYDDAEYWLDPEDEEEEDDQ
jgi:hypothetical protein